MGFAELSISTILLDIVTSAKILLLMHVAEDVHFVSNLERYNYGTNV